MQHFPTEVLKLIQSAVDQPDLRQSLETRVCASQTPQMTIKIEFKPSTEQSQQVQETRQTSRSIFISESELTLKNEVKMMKDGSFELKIDYQATSMPLSLPNVKQPEPLTLTNSKKAEDQQQTGPSTSDKNTIKRSVKPVNSNSSTPKAVEFSDSNVCSQKQAQIKPQKSVEDPAKCTTQKQLPCQLIASRQHHQINQVLSRFEVQLQKTPTQSFCSPRVCSPAQAQDSLSAQFAQLVQRSPAEPLLNSKSQTGQPWPRTPPVQIEKQTSKPQLVAYRTLTPPTNVEQSMSISGKASEGESSGVQSTVSDEVSEQEITWNKNSRSSKACFFSFGCSDDEEEQALFQGFGGDQTGKQQTPAASNDDNIENQFTLKTPDSRVALRSSDKHASSPAKEEYSDEMLEYPTMVLLSKPQQTF